MEQLYVVVFLEGCLGSLFRSAYPAYVPSLIGVERMVEGNSKLATSSSLAEIGGPGLAGALVQVIGAPFAILVDAISYVVSAVSIVPDSQPRTTAARRERRRRRIREDILEGLRLVRRHSILLPLTLRSIIAHIAGAFYGVLYMLYLIDDLHLSPFLLGVVISAGGVGLLVGSFFASPVIDRLGFGRALIWSAIGASVLGVLTPLAGGPVALATLMVFIPQLFGDGLQTIEGVAELSLIQGMIPDRLSAGSTPPSRCSRTGSPTRSARCWPRRSRARSASAAGSPSAGRRWRPRSCCSVFSPLPRVRRASDVPAVEA